MRTHKEVIDQIATFTTGDLMVRVENLGNAIKDGLADQLLIIGYGYFIAELKKRGIIVKPVITVTITGTEPDTITAPITEPEYLIMGVYRGNIEQIDTADTKKDADYLVREYSLAYGSAWRVYSKINLSRS